jgi:hypothetical protein
MAYDSGALWQGHTSWPTYSYYRVCSERDLVSQILEEPIAVPPGSYSAAGEARLLWLATPSHAKRHQVLSLLATNSVQP